MFGIIASFVWEIVSYNNFALPRAAFNGLAGLVQSLS